MPKISLRLPASRTGSSGSLIPILASSHDGGAGGARVRYLDSDSRSLQGLVGTITKFTTVNSFRVDFDADPSHDGGTTGQAMPSNDRPSVLFHYVEHYSVELLETADRHARLPGVVPQPPLEAVRSPQPAPPSPVRRLATPPAAALLPSEPTPAVDLLPSVLAVEFPDDPPMPRRPSIDLGQSVSSGADLGLVVPDRLVREPVRGRAAGPSDEGPPTFDDPAAQREFSAAFTRVSIAGAGPFRRQSAGSVNDGSPARQYAERPQWAVPAPPPDRSAHSTRRWVGPLSAAPRAVGHPGRVLLCPGASALRLRVEPSCGARAPLSGLHIEVLRPGACVDARRGGPKEEDWVACEPGVRPALAAQHAREMGEDSAPEDVAVAKAAVVTVVAQAAEFY